MATIHYSTLSSDNSSDDQSPYNYVPTEAVCAIFIGLFGFATILHAGQALRSRLWYLLPTLVLGGMLEILGWSSRLWSSKNVLASTPFLIQITATIIGPTPILAANFIIFGRIVNLLGYQYSRLSPRLYAKIFLSCDIISLVVQGTGGGLASSESESDTLGGNIILGGIIFQLVIISVFAILATEFFIRYAYDRPIQPSHITGTDQSTTSTKGPVRQRVKILSFALGFSTTVLFIRAVYRTIELAGGWHGRIISTQVYFNILDGAMVVLAIYTFNFVHPGIFLPSSESKDDTFNSTTELNIGIPTNRRSNIQHNSV